MVSGLIVFLFLLGSSSGVMYRLNDSEYAKMPPLYTLDAYERCLSRPGGLYCIADFDLFTNGKSELMDLIHEYSALTFTHFNHTQIHRGVCVSETCKNSKKHTFNGTMDLNMTLEACLNKTMFNDYGLQAKLSNINYCHKNNETITLDSSDWIVFNSYLVIIVLNTIGSFYDWFIRKDGEGNPYLMAFSLRRNWYKLVASANAVPDPRLRRIRLFHGIKSLTMICVLFSHVALIMSYTFLENPQYVEMAGLELPKQILFNGSLVTQTFFMMSGFLVAYNFKLNTEKHKASWWQLPKNVLLRWLRLVPAFALMLGTVATLMRHAGKGPLWDRVVTTESQDCRKYWWTNLLFINNYFYDNTCLLQTWYLACDFQLYILGMVICLIAKTPRAQKVIISVTIVVAMGILGAETYFKNLDATVIQSPENYRTFFRHDNTFRMIYTRGHANISTYAMGLATGFFVYYMHLQEKDFSRYKRYRWIIWITIPLAVVVILTGGIFYTDKVFPSAVKAIYAMTFKPVFELIVIIFVLGVIFKIENVQRRIIEWRGFTWTGRVSYDAYLVHTLIQRPFYGRQYTPIYASDYSVIVILAGTVFMSFIMGAALWLTVESPINALTKAMLQPARPTTHKDTKEAQELPPVVIWRVTEEQCSSENKINN